MVDPGITSGAGLGRDVERAAADDGEDAEAVAASSAPADAAVGLVDLAAPQSVSTTAPPVAQAASGATAGPDTPGAPAQATATTVGSLSAQIVNHLNRQSSRFEMTLNPEELGRVDVRLQIRADGRISAALSFGRAESASSLSARADELRASLAHAGFALAPEALTFRVDPAAPSASGGQFAASTGDGGAAAGRGQNGGGGQGARPSAFAAAHAAAGAAEGVIASGYGATSSRGVDIRV